MDSAKDGRRAVSPIVTSAWAALALAFFVSAIATPVVVAAEPFTIQNQLITLYEDGGARVEAEYFVDMLYPSVNITLPGATYLDVVVTDAGGLPMSYSIYQGGVAVNTLGEAAVSVAYTTHDITSKLGKYWTVNFTSTIQTWIAFPTGGLVVSLSATPDVIDSSGGRTKLMMPAGDIAVTYVLSIVGTPDYAYLVISDAEDTIDGIASTGINASSAEAVLAQAIDAFDSGDYAGAEELAGDAKSLALQTNATAYQASGMIATAGIAIPKAESEGRTVGVGEAMSLLNQANSFYAAGDYALSLSYATSANAKAIEAQTPLQAYLPYITIAFVAVAAIAIVMLLRARSKKQAFKGYVKERHDVDLGRIANEGQLREDDFKMMEVLAENGGEAFESEVRTKFDLPKTTIWRMAKRLEKDGYITVNTVAGQNLLKVRAEYLKNGRKNASA